MTRNSLKILTMAAFLATSTAPAAAADFSDTPKFIDASQDLSSRQTQAGSVQIDGVSLGRIKALQADVDSRRGKKTGGVRRATRNTPRALGLWAVGLLAVAAAACARDAQCSLSAGLGNRPM